MPLIFVTLTMDFLLIDASAAPAGNSNLHRDHGGHPRHVPQHGQVSSRAIGLACHCARVSG